MALVTLRALSVDDPSLAGNSGIKSLSLETDPEDLALRMRDAAAMQGSGAIGLLRPKTEMQLAHWLVAHPTPPLLAQGALTSLTGGATPNNDVVIDFSKMTQMGIINRTTNSLTVGAGLILNNLQEALADENLYYPPAPTHDGATIGGNVATNAAGAATFKYGCTRDWVKRIRVVLRHGDVLEIRRGENTLRHGDTLRITGSRQIELPMPTYRSPNVKKASAGYFVKDPWDPIDLFIGSEGTLGFITEVEVGVVPRPRVVTGLLFVDSTAQAIKIVEALREQSLQTRKNKRANGLEVRSIEYFDDRCLSLLREQNKLSEYAIVVPEHTTSCLLFEQELESGMSDEEIVDRLVAASEGRGGNDALGALMAILTQYEVMETAELAMPSDTRRKTQLAAVREAIPLAISDWLVQQQRNHPEVHKAGGDMIVPFASFGDMLERYYEIFGQEQVDVAVFGHISDGNVHPNALPRDAKDMKGAKLALMALAAEVKERGGCPLSEHGVGKHPLKKQMLAHFWGKKTMNQMRAIKRAFDPNWTLGRGVLFDPQ